MVHSVSHSYIYYLQKRTKFSPLFGPRFPIGLVPSPLKCASFHSKLWRARQRLGDIYAPFILVSKSCRCCCVLILSLQRKRHDHFPNQSYCFRGSQPAIFIERSGNMENQLRLRLYWWPFSCAALSWPLHCDRHGEQRKRFHGRHYRLAHRYDSDCGPDPARAAAAVHLQHSCGLDSPVRNHHLDGTLHSLSTCRDLLHN